jgi:hypothetical protein
LVAHARWLADATWVAGAGAPPQACRRCPSSAEGPGDPAVAAGGGLWRQQCSASRNRICFAPPPFGTRHCHRSDRPPSGEDGGVGTRWFWSGAPGRVKRPPGSWQSGGLGGREGGGGHAPYGQAPVSQPQLAIISPLADGESRSPEDLTVEEGGWSLSAG